MFKHMKPNFSLGQDLTGQLILRAGYLTVGEAVKNNARIIPDRIAIEYEKYDRKNITS